MTSIGSPQFVHIACTPSPSSRTRGVLIRGGQFVPGLSALDTPAQILAWALVFGYAQQLFTRLVGVLITRVVRLTLIAGLQPMPFTAPQSAFDPLYPAGMQWYWRADFFHEISDAAIDVHVKYGAQLPTGHSTMHLCPIDGAASQVPADATAFDYRDCG